MVENREKIEEKDREKNSFRESFREARRRYIRLLFPQRNNPEDMFPKHICSEQDSGSRQFVGGRLYR